MKGFFGEILDSGIWYQQMASCINRWFIIVFYLYMAVSLYQIIHRIWPMWVDRFLPVWTYVHLVIAYCLYTGQWVDIFSKQKYLHLQHCLNFYFGFQLKNLFKQLKLYIFLLFGLSILFLNGTYVNFIFLFPV